MELKKIVVGVDFSDPSLSAARWTARFFAPEADLVLVHSVNVPEPPSFLRGLYPPTEQLIEVARRGADIRLRELTESLRPRVITTEVRVGRPDVVLAEVGEQLGADLLVVGAHGERSGIWKLLGSTAEHVTQRATMSVLLARGCPSGPPRTVMVALDESAMTRPQLEWAAYFARAYGSKVVGIHAAKPVPFAGSGAGGAESERRSEEQLRRPVEKWIETQFAEAGVEDGRAEVAFGDAGFAILAAVDRFKADVLVIGGHGARPTSGSFMGSVAEFLLRNGTGPVLTVGPQP